MAKKHTAKLLLEYLGGKSNINEIMHCMTRLRISLSDDQLVRLSDIKKNRRSTWSQHSEGIDPDHYRHHCI